MRTGTVSYKLEDLRKGVIIPIGMVGENDFTRVIFDAEEVFKKHPDAQVTMKVQPPKGGIYPATVTRDGNTVTWQVKAADVAHRGSGELQLTFTADTMVEKSYIARTDIKRSLVGNGPAPDPVQDWVDNAEEVLEDLEAAEVHQPIIGLDGYWYTWNQGTGEYEKTNTKAQGQDGHSPVLTSSKSGKTTTIFADGDQLAQILDGEDGQGADVIDDTAGEGDTDKTWSADKLDTEITDVKSGIEGVEQSTAKVINAKKSRRPLMTFIDDDACIEFASIWPDICEEKGIKINCAVISDSVGNNTHLSWEQIEQMHEAGYVEFVNHTDAQENLTGIEPEEVYTRVKKCKDALLSHGIKTGDILVYPYGAYDETAIDAFKGICRCGITTDKGSEVTWNEPALRTFALWRNELVEPTAETNPTLAWMKSVVDAAVEHKAWVIWMSHSQYAGFNYDEIANIKSLIDYAVEKGVDIVTASEALDMYANAFEVGRYQHNGRANGLVIGCDGTTYGKGANFVEEHNTYMFHTPAKDFPINNIIANFVSGSSGVGLVDDGVILSVIAPTTQSEFRADSYQIYKQISEDKLFYRGFASDGLPNDFLLMTPTSGISTNRPKYVAKGYCYFDTTLGKPVFASKTTQRAWYKLTITAGTTGAGTTKFSGVAVELDAGLTKQEVKDVVAEALCPLRTTSPTPGMIYYTPKELGLEDDGFSLYCMRSAPVDYTTDLWVDPVAPDTGCRGTYTRLRDGIAAAWVDATGTAV